MHYKIYLLASFNASYKKLKKHYKKNKVGINLFEKQIAKYFALLGETPAPSLELARAYDASIKNIKPTKYNSNIYLSQWNFQKLYFNLPALTDAKSLIGRLLYVIDEEQKSVYLLCIYNKRMFNPRPSDGEMKKMLQGLKQEHYD